jgi:methyl-accepting chemotaxis protein
VLKIRTPLLFQIFPDGLQALLADLVAMRIKELAKQTSAATLEIKEKIANIQNSTDGTVEGINEITQVIASVNEIVSTIATAVEEQSAATKEIADNIE